MTVTVRIVSEEDYEAVILRLLSERRPEATICPSEAARALGEADWRRRMDPVRAAAARLVRAGEIEIVQHGQAVDGRTARGPIRLRRVRHPGPRGGAKGEGA